MGDIFPKVLVVAVRDNEAIRLGAHVEARHDEDEIDQEALEKIDLK